MNTTTMPQAKVGMKPYKWTEIPFMMREVTVDELAKGDRFASLKDWMLYASTFGGFEDLGDGSMFVFRLNQGRRGETSFQLQKRTTRYILVATEAMSPFEKWARSEAADQWWKCPQAVLRYRMSQNNREVISLLSPNGTELLRTEKTYVA